MPRTPAAGADAFARQSWAEAVDALGAVPRGQLRADDLERLAVAAYLTGRDDESVAAWEHAYRQHRGDAAHADAARCAFWAAFCLMMQGQMAHAGGWLQRTEQAVGDAPDCAAAGFLRIPALLQALDADDPELARQLSVEAAEIAEACGDRDLAAFATLGHGQALLAMGKEAAGIARLDDVMLSVTAGEVGPIVSGVVYCAVLLECMQLLDLARAAEWTESLDAWCVAQPDLVPYRGQCLVHQSQLQQANGRWADALATAASARTRLTDPPHPALGLAYYQQGELGRLRGEHDEAAAAYREASRIGYSPLPGLALLVLARGDVAAASVSIQRALAEAGRPFQRPRLLDAAVEIHLAGGDVASARTTADEFAAVADGCRSEVIVAMAEHAQGSILLAEGRAADALARLRAASTAWQRLRMPYEAARTAELIGRACLALGDRSCAELELDGARETFESLGAAPDLERLRQIGDLPATSSDGVLSARELEVLAHVAGGKTNREVAEALSISQHTVGRHLENIFVKLGVRTRAAAIAHAYEHDLL